MTPEDWQRLKALLDGALQREAGAREAYLREACGDDAEMLERAESLIASSEESWDGLEGGASRLTDLEGGPRTGERIGAYEILDEIGHGGMGTVYLGKRADEEFRQRVAIKLVRRGMDTDFVLRRFRHERQILAGLDHPHIARLAEGSGPPAALRGTQVRSLAQRPCRLRSAARKASRASREGGVMKFLWIVLAAAALLKADSLSPAHSFAEAAVVGHVLDDWHAAAAAAQEERYFSHLAPGAVFLGTDATERWTVEEFRRYAHPYFAKGKAWSFKSIERHVSFSNDGSVAWFDEKLDTPNLGPARGSGVLIRAGGEWKIAQYNLSVPIPNELMKEFKQRIGDLRQSAAPGKPKP